MNYCDLFTRRGGMTVYCVSTADVDIISIFHISARVGREKMCNKAEMFMGISSRAESSNIYTSRSAVI